MAIYKITISDEQNKALINLAAQTERTPQDIIDEQCSYYIKNMLSTEIKRLNILTNENKVLNDEQQAELAALLLNTKNQYISLIK